MNTAIKKINALIDEAHKKYRHHDDLYWTSDEPAERTRQEMNRSALRGEILGLEKAKSLFTRG